MILEILRVVMPVFLVIGAGYAATRSRIFSHSAVDGLMVFTQNFAIPCVLFRGVVGLDLGAVFDPWLLTAFYSGAVASFALGALGARHVFKRRPGESVAIGFGALFSNTLLLGVPITERAYGADALAPTFAIIAVHAPFCYLIGITTMELVRADGRGLVETGRSIGAAMFRNALMIGLALGLALNLSGADLPGVVHESVGLVADAAIPAALFGLGGVLTRYALRTSLGEASMVTVLSLVVHPAITFWLAHVVFALPPGFVRSAVLTAAMAPGVSVYVFASMYSRGQRQAASSVLLATGASVISVTMWLTFLANID